MPPNLARLRRVLGFGAILFAILIIFACGSLGTFVNLTHTTIILRLPNAEVQVMYVPPLHASSGLSSSYRQMGAPEEIVIGWVGELGTRNCVGDPRLTLGDVEAVYFECIHSGY